FGYATNWYRAGASLVLALLLAQILILGGVLRHIAFLGIFDLGWFSIVLIVAFLVVVVVEAVLVPAPAPPGPFHQGARAWGLATACLSALGLAIALGIAAAQTTRGAQKLGSYPTTLSPRIVNTYGGPDTDLAWTLPPPFHLVHTARIGPAG